MATTYDSYGRGGTQDAGSPMPPNAPVAGSGNAAAVYLHRVTQTAGVGTTANLQINVGYKCRIVDAWVLTTSGVASSQIQLWTGTGGTGTACSSAMATASSGKTRDALTTASQVIALGGLFYAYASGGATLAGVEVCVLVTPEQ